MPLFVDRSAVFRLLEERHSGLDGFLQHWENRKIGVGSKATARARRKSTIYRWLEEGLPTQQDTLFDFFGALDVDPLSLVDFERSEIQKRFQQIRLAFFTGGESAREFRAFFDLYRPGPAWPHNGLSMRYFSRLWHVREFSHPTNELRNAYAAVAIDPEKSELAAPFVVHVAYSHGSDTLPFWRPYGAIIRRAGRDTLIHENGNYFTRGVKSKDAPVVFETFFGPEPVVFRVASLHGFEAEVEFPSMQTDVLRFGGR